MGYAMIERCGDDSVTVARLYPALVWHAHHVGPGRSLPALSVGLTTAKIVSIIRVVEKM